MKGDDIRQPSPHHRIFRSSFCPCDPRLLVCNKGQITELKAVQIDMPVFVELDVKDDNLGGVDANRHRCAIRFVALYTVDVNNPFLAVHLSNLSFPTLVLPAHNSDFVVLTDRK